MTARVAITGNLQAPASWYYIDAYDGIEYTRGSNMRAYIQHTDRARPDTTRNPKSRSGWRSPSNYYRIETFSTPNPSGQIITYMNPDRNGKVTKYREVNSPFANVSSVGVTYASANMANAALIQALSKLKGQNINLSVAFGERKEAAEMMSNTVINIAKSIRKFKGANPKQWLKVLKNQTGHGKVANIPNSWLEVQYGWKPLMQDVHGAVQALNNRERDGDAYRATVKAVKFEDNSRRIVAPAGLYSVYDFQFKDTCGVKVRLDYTLENPVLASLAQLGITNPAELVWELVPYSFVVDWFLPVGSYLSAFDAALGWGFKGGSITTFARGYGEAHPTTESSLKARGGSILASGRFVYKHFSMTRNVYDHSPLPRFPGIKNPLSTGHIANAMSLLVSAFR